MTAVDGKTGRRKIPERYSKAVFVAVLALIAIPETPFSEFRISPPFALFSGIVFAWFFTPVFAAFTKKAQKFLLQASVVGLGFGMNVNEAVASGREGMTLTVFSVAAVMVLGMLAARLMKVEKKTGYLISAGTAICGGSAIAAVAPIVDADEDSMSVSLGTVFLLNALALFVFPPLGRIIGLGEIEFGEWAAIAIHDTSSVVGASAAYGDEALKVAATVKCTRALWILPLAGVTALLYHRKGAKITVPWFIFLFALAMIVNTYCSLPSSFGDGIVVAAKRGFAITLFLIGTALGPKSLRACGFKPFVLGVVLWAAIALLSILVIIRR